jgi:hypothetical protein
VSSRELACWLVFVVAVYVAAWIVLRVVRREQPADWHAPCEDVPDADDHARDIPPVIETEDGLICAARVEALPGKICAFPAPCPDHGRMSSPGLGEVTYISDYRNRAGA